MSSVKTILTGQFEVSVTLLTNPCLTRLRVALHSPEEIERAGFAELIDSVSQALTLCDGDLTVCALLRTC